MQYRIVCYGWRCVGYGPFDSEDEARAYANKYLHDCHNEFIPYETIDGNIATDDKINVILTTGGIDAHDF